MTAPREIHDYTAGTPVASDVLVYQPDAGGTTKKCTPVQLVGAGRVSGSAYVNSGAAAITMTTQSVWYGIVNLTAGPLHGGVLFTDDATADYFTVPAAGEYRVIFTGGGVTNFNATIEIATFVDGVLCTRGCTCRRDYVNGAPGNIVGHSVPTLAAGAKISLRVRNTTSAGKTYTPTFLSVTVERFGV